MIQDKALTYWYEMNVPEPPPFPKPTTQIPPETLAHRLGLTSDDEASSTTSDSTTSPILTYKLLVRLIYLNIYKYTTDLL
jgi:hypothetical protein